MPLSLRERAVECLFGENFRTTEDHDDDERCYGHPFKPGSGLLSVNDIITELTDEGAL